MKWGLLTPLERKALNRARSKTYQRRYLAAHPERRAASIRNYYQRNREVHMERTNRWRDNNLERVRELQREWCKNNPDKAYQKGLRQRLAHPEKRRALNRNWARRNPLKIRANGARRRAKIAKAPGYLYTTSEHIQMRWEMFGSKCWICHRDAQHTDHVKPLTAGGSHYPGNLRPICRACNSRKKDRWPIPDYVFTRSKFQINNEQPV